MKVILGEIPVTITKKNIRNLHLYVKPPDGRVEVTAPRRMPQEMILAFISGKLDWIRTRRAKLAAGEAPIPRQYVSGEPLWLWGRRYTLRVAEGAHYAIALEGDAAVFTVRSGSTAAHRERWLNEWYRAELTRAVPPLLEKWESVTGLHPSGWQSKNMTTRWGSCNTRTGKIWLNLRLAKHAPASLAYVIVHELVHLKVPNHGVEFAALMDSYMPDWRQRRRCLNESGID